MPVGLCSTDLFSLEMAHQPISKAMRGYYFLAYYTFHDFTEPNRPSPDSFNYELGNLYMKHIIA